MSHKVCVTHAEANGGAARRAPGDTEGLAALLDGTGLRLTRMTATPVPLYHVLPPRLHGRALAALHGASAAAARVLPRLLGYQFVALARQA